MVRNALQSTATSTTAETATIRTAKMKFVAPTSIIAKTNVNTNNAIGGWRDKNDGDGGNRDIKNDTVSVGVAFQTNLRYIGFPSEVTIHLLAETATSKMSWFPPA